MKRIVLTTSSCSAEHLGTARGQIGIIPLHLRLDGREFLDNNQEVTHKTLSQMMMTHPKTRAGSRPATADEVSEIFANLYQHGYDEVFVCCLSSKLSESYKILQEQQSVYAGRMNIYIYDTKTVNLGEAALAYEANHMVQGGAPFSEVIAHLDKLRPNSTLSFSLHDLTHMIYNKKLSTPAGFVANLFDIKPIVELTPEGLVIPTSKVREFERAFKKMIEDVDEVTRGRERYIYLVSLGNPELLDYCSGVLKAELGIKSLPIIPVSCVSICNHGPEGAGIGTFYGRLPKIIQELPEYKEF